MASCETCLDLDWRYFNNSYNMNRVSVVYASAEKGCPICGMLSKCIKGLVSIRDASKHDCGLLVLDNRKSPASHFEFRVTGRLLEETMLWKTTGTNIELYKEPSKRLSRNTDPWGILREACNIPEDTSSEESLEWAERELEDCSQRHYCLDQRQKPMPTRVLDIGRSDEPNVRVVCMEREPAQYVAFSHRWGNTVGMTHKLTTHTLNEYQKGIQLEALPRTFQDAICFTRRLKIRYLWIDSLCIIQEDKDRDSESDKQVSRKDWEREAKRMSSVYQNAYLTLAAASSTGCQTGLFHRAGRVECRGTTSNGSPFHLFGRKEIKHRAKDFPLLNRGWVLQEVVLSPRTLYFGEDELFWHCRERLKCQCSEINQRSANLEWFHDFTKVPRLEDEQQFMTSFDIVRKWHHLVRLYSRMALTYPSDRLVAIDGLADYIRRLKGGQSRYLMGLWEDSLAIDLLWFTSRSARIEQEPSDPAQRSFPTWSWASNSGHVHWILVEHLSFGVNPSYPPKDAILMQQAKSQRSQHPHQLQLQGVIVPIKLKNVKGLESVPSLRGRSVDGDFFADYDLRLMGKGWIDPDATVHCMRVLNWEYGRASLVLRCVDEVRGLYERIGVISLGERWRDDSGQRDKSYSWWDGDGVEEAVITLL